MTSRLESGHAKICELDVTIFVEQDVLRLEVSMADVVSMAVRKTRNDLAKQADSFFLGQSSPAGDIVEEFSPRNIFKDEISVILHQPESGSSGLTVLQFPPIFPHIVQADDIWMIDELHDDDFPFDTKWHCTSPAGGLGNVGVLFHGCHASTLDHRCRLLRDDLDSSRLSCQGMLGKPDSTGCAFAKCFP